LQYSNYGWIITWANPNIFRSDEIHEYLRAAGPRNIDPEFYQALNAGIDPNNDNVFKFSLYDDDNEIYFRGVMIAEGDAEGCEPLYDWGEAFGCVMLKADYRDGKVEYFG